MMDGERSEWEQSAPHDAFERCHLQSIIYVAFQGRLLNLFRTNTENFLDHF